MPPHGIGDGMNYQQAADLFAKARDKYHGKPMGSNTRLVTCKVGDVDTYGILYHSTVVVAFMPDGSEVLNSGGWHTVTTAKRFRDYSSARVSNDYAWNDAGTHSADKWWHVWTSVARRTSSKVRTCRTCKGAGQQSQTDTGTWDGHAYVKYDVPVVRYFDCYRCKGAGEVDYGSRPIHDLFIDGVVVRNGQVIGYGPVPVTSAAQPASRSRSGWRPVRTFAEYVPETPTHERETYTPSYVASTHADAPSEHGVDYGTAAEMSFSHSEADEEIAQWRAILDRAKSPRRVSH